MEVVLIGCLGKNCKDKGGMGFRNLYAFNLAMLGKQGWKLVANPDALVSKNFKAKYYPRGIFYLIVQGVFNYGGR